MKGGISNPHLIFTFRYNSFFTNQLIQCFPPPTSSSFIDTYQSLDTTTQAWTGISFTICFWGFFLFFGFYHEALLSHKTTCKGRQATKAKQSLRRNFRSTTTTDWQIRWCAYQSPLLQMSQALLHANLHHVRKHLLCFTRLLLSINLWDNVADDVF